MASIKKITGKNGEAYKITVSMGRDEQDKQIRHYMTWRPGRPMTARQIEKEVQRVAFEFERSLLQGFQVDNRQTFEQYAAYVFELREQRGDKPQTLDRVKRQTERINEYIGSMKIVDIRPQHLNAIYKQMSQPGANIQGGQFYEPAIDFTLLLGERGYSGLAEKCHTDKRVISQLCKGKAISKKNADSISKYLERDDLFKEVRSDKALSPGTIRNYHSVIHSILAQAEKELIIPYNPAKKATLPKKRQKEQDILQPEQITAVLDALQSEPIQFRTMITLFVFTGCRRGEILALTWEKVDLKERKIKIDCSLNYLPGRGTFIGAAKTDNVRFISIPQEVAKLLKEYRIWQLEQGGSNSKILVFPSSCGREKNPNSFNRELKRFCSRHGLPAIHPHTFRHTAASILIESGADVISVAQMLGHKDVKMTLNTYGHALEDSQKKMAECIANAILRKNVI